MTPRVIDDIAAPAAAASAAPAAAPSAAPSSAMSGELATTLAEGWAVLVRGASDRLAASRSPTLATIGRDGAPTLRTVVLRRCVPGQRLLLLHTDVRSIKIGELAADPRAAVHVWEPYRRIQVRLACEVAVHWRDAVAMRAWGGVPPAARDVYRIMPPPGTPIAAPDAASPVTAEEGGEPDGAHFAVLAARVTRLEYLHIGPERHRRAAFAWDGAAWQGTWLAP